MRTQQRWRFAGRAFGASSIAASIAIAIVVTVVVPVAAQEVSPSPPATTEVAVPSDAELLEAAIPRHIAGYEIETISFSGDDIVASADEDDPIRELESIAAAAGANISDLALASGSAVDEEVFVGVLAAWLGGVPAAEFASELTPLLLETGPEAQLTHMTIAGREVVRVAPGSGLTGDDPVYVVESGETAWYVATDEALLEEVIEALP